MILIVVEKIHPKFITKALLILHSYCNKLNFCSCRRQISLLVIVICKKTYVWYYLRRPITSIAIFAIAGKISGYASQDLLLAYILQNYLIKVGLLQLQSKSNFGGLIFFINFRGRARGLFLLDLGLFQCFEVDFLIICRLFQLYFQTLFTAYDIAVKTSDYAYFKWNRYWYCDPQSLSH